MKSKEQDLQVLFLVNDEKTLLHFRMELIERVKQEGMSFGIIMPIGDKAGVFEDLGAQIVPLEMDRKGTNIFCEVLLLFKHIKLLRKLKPKLALLYTIKPNIYGGLACRMLKIPYLVNITGLGTAVENPGVLQHLTTFLYKHALKGAQRVFFQNTENRAFFEEKRIALGKHALLPGSGVNLTRFTPLPYPPEETIEFVFISRIMKEKGIEEYLETARVIRSKYSNTRFHICGFCEEAYEGTLKELQEKGIIIYHGMVDDVREVLRVTHCAVLPSYHEGMANALLESSACARPVITTNKSGCKEVVDEGINGFLVPVCDTESLIKAVERFILLPHEQKIQMGLAGRKKVEREFDRQIVVDAYMKEIAQIIGNKDRKDLSDDRTAGSR